MSLGRSIQLSGLYWEIKSSSLLMFPFAALHDEGWEGGWKEGPSISDVSYCTQRRWQVWHLADETHELPSETSAPHERKETNRGFVKVEYLDRPLVAGCRAHKHFPSIVFLTLCKLRRGTLAFMVFLEMVVRTMHVQLFGADGCNKREKTRVVSRNVLPIAKARTPNDLPDTRQQEPQTFHFGTMSGCSHSRSGIHLA